MKRYRKAIVGVVAVVLIMVTGLQLFRIGVIQQLIAVKTVASQSIQTMTGVHTVNDGETLTVSIITEIADAGNDPNISNITQALTYAKIPFELRHPAALEGLEPSPYHILVIANESTENLPYEFFRSFVEQGGRLYVAERFFDPMWNELVGIESSAGFLPDAIYGIQFEKTVFPGYESIPSLSTFSNSMLQASVKKEAQVYATAGGHPLLWTYKYGKGKVVYLNGTMAASKTARGFITQALGLAAPAFVSAQAAIKVVFIDDFPAPIPAGDNKNIKQEYNVSIKNFYKNIWWEDMKQLAEEHHLKFTNVFIGTYDNTDEQTAEDLIKQSSEQMIYFGRTSLARGDELGYHGYNHQSLVTEDEPIDPSYQYIPWSSQKQMEKAIQEAEKLFEHYFPNYPLKVYVPPSNAINQTGTAALVHALPTLQTIAGLYEGNEESGSLSYEFGFDPVYKKIYNLPRVSSGYEQPLEELFFMTDAIANFGVFSHFIHPDDVLDEKRSKGEGWKEMNKALNDLFTTLDRTYPYLQAYTASEAREKLIQYQKSELYVYYGENTIAISGENLVNPADIIVRLEAGRALEEGSFDGYKVTRLDQSEPIYSITFTKPAITINMKDAT